MHIPGPNGRIAYDRDELGYPRISVRDELEGAFARGYFHALDRLVQVRLTLLLSQGRAMEVLGDKPMLRAVDRFVRTFDFTSDVQQRIDDLDDETYEWLEAYCDGFNAGEAERKRPWPLRLLGLNEPEFSVRDIITIYRLVSFFGLTSLQMSAELLIAELLGDKTNPRLFDLLLGDAGRGLDPSAFSDLALDPEVAFLGGHIMRGSNAFAVSGARSKSGGALFMGEFHMEVGKFPPGLYAFHLDYEDGDYLCGMSIPGFAWLSAGRTSSVGWSYTYAHADNVDLRIAPSDGYEVREETVEIRGKSAETWTFEENVHGTRVGPSTSNGAPHLRWAGLDEIHRDLVACRRVSTAENVDELVEINREIRSISLEAVIADKSGRVATVTTGIVDRRDAPWTGAYPALVAGPPADADEATRPVSIDPPAGFAVSANQGSAWATLPEPPYRYELLERILAQKDQATLDDLVRASYDDRDLCMERLVPVWTPLLSEPVELTRGLFHALHEQLVIALLARDIGEAGARRFCEDLGGTLLFEAHLDRALALERPDVLSKDELQALLAEALPKARPLAEDTHPVRARFTNMITQGKEPGFLGLSRGPFELPGGPTSPFQSRRVHFLGEALYFGPSFHLVFDMRERGAWYHVPGGASERRFGPGYGRGVELWCEGRFLPLGHPTGAPPSIER